jgi:uncharacterized protein
MKKLILFFGLFLFSVSCFSQQQKLRVVWDLAQSDTLSHAAVYRQINNILVEVPDLQIEVVLHGAAVFYMTKDSTYFDSRIKVAKSKGVVFSVCNNSLKRFKIDPSTIKSDAGIVPSAMVELVRRQNEGWSYIKAGH